MIESPITCNISSKNNIFNDFKVDTNLPHDIQVFLSKIPDKKIYNKLCLKYHPDKGGQEEMFKIINNHMNP